MCSIISSYKYRSFKFSLHLIYHHAFIFYAFRNKCLSSDADNIIVELLQLAKLLIFPLMGYVLDDYLFMD